MKYFILLLFLTCSSNTEVQSKTLFVADHLEDCVGVGPQTCMLVRESPEDSWTYFYDKIEGFNYEEGYIYELRVEESTVRNPAADASSIKYTLKEIVSKVSTADVSELFKKWKVIKIKELDTTDASPTMIFQEEDNRVSGFAGCNNYFSTYSVHNNALSFDKTGSTRKLCKDMSVENAFLKTLGSVVKYEVVKKELHLFDINNEMIMLAISE